MAIFVPRFVRQLRDVLLTAPADGEVLTYDSADEKWKNEAGGGGAHTHSGLTRSISQVAHGLAVGNAVRFNGSAYVKAQADSAPNSEVVGLVSAVASVDAFTLETGGLVTGLSGLTAGEVYFLSPTSAGALTATEPTTVGQVSKPLLVADSTTSGYLFNFRGAIVTAGNGTVTARAQYVGIPTAIPAGTLQLLTWDAKTLGDDLLDLSVVTVPVVVTAGIYAVNVQVDPNNMTVGATYNLDVELDADGEDAVNAIESTPATAVWDTPSTVVSLTYYVPAGGTLKSFVRNRDSIEIFFQLYANVQRIT